MKHCPSCNFTFPDFHVVCDFDGTRLVSDPERALAIAARPSLVRRCLKSPNFLAVAGLIAVVSSAVLIGYLDARRQTGTARTVAQKNAVDVAAPVTTDLPPQQSSVKRVVAITHQISTHQIRPAKHSTTVSTHFAESRREAKPPRLAQSPSLSPPNYQPRPSPQQSSKAQGSEVALPTRSQLPTTSQPPAHQKPKEPLVTAMLKSTWRVLKKPFKF